MTDLVATIAIITLAVLLLVQTYQQYIYSKLMTEELEKCMKAVMSRNINEYLSATAPRSDKAQDFTDNDQVDMSELTDDQFFDFLEPKKAK